MSDGEKMVWVHAKHMLDAYWKLSAFNLVFHEEGSEMPGIPDGDADLNPAKAEGRIVGSTIRLPKTGEVSARLT